LRQSVEHRIARLMQLGMRQARYFGRVKTLYQLLMAATVANLTLVATKRGLMRGRKREANHLCASFSALVLPFVSALWAVVAHPFGYSHHSRLSKVGFRPGF
jgi:hypothetical protein